MPDGPFNRIYQLFAGNKPAEAVRLLRLELTHQTRRAFSQGYQLVPDERTVRGYFVPDPLGPYRGVVE